ncbi:MAG TPA: AAA family ATPase [Pirellulaceae bacterium]|jgi:hypothetical protein|nr:AAA family ATPase [Pirellulaceae bacterium]
MSASTAATPASGDKLAEMLERINSLTRSAEEAPVRRSPQIPPPPIVPTMVTAAPAVHVNPEGSASNGAAAGKPPRDRFIPKEPQSLREAGLNESEVEGLILKYLLARGEGTGRDLSNQLRLPFSCINDLVVLLKQRHLIAYKGTSMMNDFQCVLSELGLERARRLAAHCTYFGSAPVGLEDYIASVKAQTLESQHPTPDKLAAAFGDLLINKRMFDRLGPALNSGRGMFLYGAPGNGKTVIAERVTAVFGETVWIPRSLGIDGEIIRLFDPMNHVEAPIEAPGTILDDKQVDQRWVRIKRPTIVAGGELTMTSLEISENKATGICEAPLQLKSNCGTLVIDDFGRQRMSVDELLNRWIVPLEKRYDYLNLPNGKKVQVPFDQMIVFSTNLEPRDLVDDAFLRRIPYKIEVVDPTPAEFHELFRIFCPKFGFTYQPKAIDYLLETHYARAKRRMKNCHPRDLMLQIRNHCRYQGLQLELRPEYFDFACETYFSIV